VTVAGGFPTYDAERRLAAARAEGAAPVPLHGTPSPALPAHVVDAVVATLSRPMAAPPPRGLLALREAYADELERSTGRGVDPGTDLLVTHGAMHALSVTMRGLLHAGDEVVVPAPCFFFDGPIRGAGGTPVYVSSTEEDGWRWDAAAIERAVGPRTRALLLCNPGNPAGNVPSPDEVASVVALAAGHGLTVVTDEAYEGCIWQGSALASAFPLADDVVIIRSLGKSLSLPQLRLGVVAGPARRLDAIARVLEWDCLRVGLPAQDAAVAVLNGPRDWLADVYRVLDADRVVALAAVTDTPGLIATPPEAAPFLFVRAV
jgi:aspartate/methionine/tyrosine aminotransferase